jgi:hypothetical protein
VGRAAELVVADDPTVGQALAAPLKQIGGDPPLLPEDDLLGHVTLLPAARVVGPILGQVEPPVQGRIATGVA